MLFICSLFKCCTNPCTQTHLKSSSFFFAIEGQVAIFQRIVSIASQRNTFFAGAKVLLYYNSRKASGRRRR